MNRDSNGSDYHAALLEHVKDQVDRLAGTLATLTLQLKRVLQMQADQEMREGTLRLVEDANTRRLRRLELEETTGTFDNEHRDGRERYWDEKAGAALRLALKRGWPALAAVAGWLAHHLGLHW